VQRLRYVLPGEAEIFYEGRPCLRRPISVEQLHREVQVLLHIAKLPSKYFIDFPESLNQEHARNPRRFAQVETQTRTFEFAHAILMLPWRYRLGLQAHEVGHVLDPAGGEDEADAAAYEHLHVRIGYDHAWPGKGLQVAI
jgi:hypothetical protein